MEAGSLDWGHPRTCQLDVSDPDEGCHLLLKLGHTSDTGLPGYHQGTMGCCLQGACQTGYKCDKALLSLNAGIGAMVLEARNQDRQVLRDKHATEKGKLPEAALYSTLISNHISISNHGYSLHHLVLTKVRISNET